MHAESEEQLQQLHDLFLLIHTGKQVMVLRLLKQFVTKILTFCCENGTEALMPKYSVTTDIEWKGG